MSNINANLLKYINTDNSVNQKLSLLYEYKNEYLHYNLCLNCYFLLLETHTRIRLPTIFHHTSTITYLTRSPLNHYQAGNSHRIRCQMSARVYMYTLDIHIRILYNIYKRRVGESKRAKGNPADSAIP